MERKHADGGKAVTFHGGEECILLLGESALTKTEGATQNSKFMDNALAKN